MASESLPRYSWKSYSSSPQQLYLTSTASVDQAIDNLNLHGPFGLDIEWKPNFRRGEQENPVALIQIANNDTTLLIHVSAMSGIPAKLVEFLANPLIVKAGVGIQGDIKKISRDLNISPIRNCVDLALLARSVDNDKWKGRYKDPIGLSRLLEWYEQKSLDKGKATTMSNWASVLSDIQMDYASNDAHAGYILYQRLTSLTDKPLPKSSYYSFDLYNGRLYEPDEPLASSSSPPPTSSWAPDFSTDPNFFSLIEWRAYNPDYDPGPPPPPREPRQDGSDGRPKSNSQLKREAKELKRREAKSRGSYPLVPMPASPMGAYGSSFTPMPLFGVREGAEQRSANRPGWRPRRGIPNAGRGVVGQQPSV